MFGVAGPPIPERESFAVNTDALVPVALRVFLRSECDCRAVAGVGWKAEVALCGSRAIRHC